ncbi:alpha/beta hydrolase family protein [Oricola sp.]|uniref:alpha/beta hydrolase family protein n=1 Tax=Oricola sp. TaxID=1979950 RepID=UPI003BAA225C
MLGKKTTAAFAKYSMIAVPIYGMKPGPLIPSTSSDWCVDLSERHPVRTISGRQFRRMTDNPGHDVWQGHFGKGWLVRIHGWVAGLPPDDVVFFAHGDDLPLGEFSGVCGEVNSMLRYRSVRARLQYVKVTACVFRPYASVPRKRRQAEEIAEFVEVIEMVSSMWPAAESHCTGQSGGALLCLAAAQHVATDFGCVVAAAPPSALRMLGRMKHGKLSRLAKRAYDPLDHVAKTRGERIMIVGDKEDDVVSYKVWDAFIEAAASHGIEVVFQRVYGWGHNVRGAGAAHTRVCLEDLKSG